ncbi:MAG: hypothetical protein HQM03_04710 [Magnetococcales bacterium]|nr:hypothetical protein [Magnetococcales bacterium]
MNVIALRVAGGIVAYFLVYLITRWYTIDSPLHLFRIAMYCGAVGMLLTLLYQFFKGITIIHSSTPAGKLMGWIGAIMREWLYTFVITYSLIIFYSYYRATH